jgi:uncharacterized membrane protein
MLTYLSAALSGAVNPFWPHLVLLAVSVLAGAGVGLGIIFEAPEYSSGTHRIAQRLVIAGVILESICTVSLFVFDEGISNAQQAKLIERAETERAMIEQLKPRTLKPEQHDALVAA